jgi:ABC-2 type transport system ATP-binding protein
LTAGTSNSHGQPLIDVRGLTFDYPGVRALDDVSFTLHAGGITALVGPNGAGKSTLMRCIAGLETPLSGQISVAGIDALDHPREIHRRVGYLSDFFGLYDALTVGQCLWHAAAVQGVSRANILQCVEATAAELGLFDRLGQRAGQLSRGLRQRVAIGQAIIHSPPLLMLDEPASGLDPESRHALSQLLVRLRERGITLVVSSHILAELEEYSTDMLILGAGRVVEQTVLNAPHPAGARIRIALASAVDDLAVRLFRYANLEVLELSADSALVVVAGDKTERHALLARLIGDGLPVCAFSEEAIDLQRSYLDSLRRARGQA